MNWTHEKDIELIASGIGSEMHNWFVFCRKWKVTTDESVSRMRELRKSGVYEKLKSDAYALWESRKSEREANSQKLQEIFDKGVPASTEDRNWLSFHEW